jgi:ABC-2 type transport system ATP-binding protein
MINNYHEAQKFIECQVNENFDVAQLNKMAFDANITLTHLVERKRSLEQEFLEITKNK